MAPLLPMAVVVIIALDVLAQSPMKSVKKLLVN